MTSERIELHPVVAGLAAAMERSPDGTRVVLPPPAIEAARAKVLASTDPEVVQHLIALAVKVHRIAGDGGFPVIAAIALLVAEKLGSATAAADKFGAAGLADAAAAIGGTQPVRAPREAAPAGPAVKARRGLSK